MRKSKSVNKQVSDKVNQMNNIHYYFAENIEYLISLRQLTYSDVKRATGIPAATLADWRTGRIPRDPVKLKKLSLLLQISLDDLLFKKLKP